MGQFLVEQRLAEGILLMRVIRPPLGASHSTPKERKEKYG
jgi:hypothetical protein